MNIDQYIADLIKREGGYVNDPKDPGGPTNYGITQAVARANGFKGHMQMLPLATAQTIYRLQYWTQPRFDRVNTVSPVVAEELLDTGVNCGVPFTKPLLQRALNLLNNNGTLYPELDPDGVYGDKTINALSAYLKQRGKAGEAVLVKVLNILQGARYIELCERNKTLEKYFYGWIANRVS